MKKSWSKMQLSVLALTVSVLIFAIIYGTQSYYSYQQVTSASNQCYDQGGYPKVVKSGWEMKVFECNFYEEE